jgi:hypothetical protein
MAESALAQELRHMAAVLWRDADKHADPDASRLIASAWHATALKLEAGAINSIDDCSEVYADYPGDCAIFDLMDVDSDHADPLPVKASREAE